MGLLSPKDKLRLGLLLLKKSVIRVDDADQHETWYNDRVLSGLPNSPTNNSI